MATDGKPTAEEERAARLAHGPQRGPGWHLEWAESAFSPGFRFQYVVLDGPCVPWAGLDDMLVERGYRTRAELLEEEPGPERRQPGDPVLTRRVQPGPSEYGAAAAGIPSVPRETAAVVRGYANEEAYAF